MSAALRSHQRSSSCAEWLVQKLTSRQSPEDSWLWHAQPQWDFSFTLPQPKAQGASWKTSGKSVRAQGQRGPERTREDQRGPERTREDQRGLMVMSHSSCASLHKACTSSSQSACQHGWGGEPALFKGVASGRWAMPQRMALYCWVYGKHQLDQWTIKKRHEVRRS